MSVLENSRKRHKKSASFERYFWRGFKRFFAPPPMLSVKSATAAPPPPPLILGFIFCL
jgi:hypothetical protein